MFSCSVSLCSCPLHPLFLPPVLCALLALRLTHPRTPYTPSLYFLSSPTASCLPSPLSSYTQPLYSILCIYLPLFPQPRVAHTPVPLNPRHRTFILVPKASLSPHAHRPPFYTFPGLSIRLNPPEPRVPKPSSCFVYTHTPPRYTIVCPGDPYIRARGVALVQ